MVDVEYPKKHDVSRVLKKVKDRFPPWFNVEAMARISRSLVEKRELAMYVDEARMVPASQLFDETSAQEALSQAEKVHAECKQLLEEFLTRQKKNRFTLLEAEYSKPF